MLSPSDDISKLADLKPNNVLVSTPDKFLFPNCIVLTLPLSVRSNIFILSLELKSISISL